MHHPGAEGGGAEGRCGREGELARREKTAEQKKHLPGRRPFASSSAPYSPPGARPTDPLTPVRGQLARGRAATVALREEKERDAQQRFECTRSEISTARAVSPAAPIPRAPASGAGPCAPQDADWGGQAAEGGARWVLSK